MQTIQRTPFEEALMTVAEAAAIAKISPRTIHRWIKRGWVIGYGLGRSPRVLLDDVLPLRTYPTAATVEKVQGVDHEPVV
jgi:excisionase family DNA binding protein